jgi:hypothetical protein
VHSRNLFSDAYTRQVEALTQKSLSAIHSVNPQRRRQVAAKRSGVLAFELRRRAKQKKLTCGPTVGVSRWAERDWRKREGPVGSTPTVGRLCKVLQDIFDFPHRATNYLNILLELDLAIP